MKRYTMYKSIMKYLADKDLSLNALELSKYCSHDIETIKDTMLELRIMKHVKHDSETNMLLAGPSHYDEWDDSIVEDLYKKAQKKNKSDKER